MLAWANAWWLDDLEVVYVCADGLCVKDGLEDSQAALLVLIGALANGPKVVLAGVPPAELQAAGHGNPDRSAFEIARA